MSFHPEATVATPSASRLQHVLAVGFDQLQIGSGRNKKRRNTHDDDTNDEEETEVVQGADAMSKCTGAATKQHGGTCYFNAATAVAQVALRGRAYNPVLNSLLSTNPNGVALGACLLFADAPGADSVAWLPSLREMYMMLYNAEVNTFHICRQLAYGDGKGFLNLRWLVRDDYGGVTQERLLREIASRRGSEYNANMQRFLPDFIPEDVALTLTDGGYSELVLLAILMVSDVKWVLHRYQRSDEYRSVNGVYESNFTKGVLSTSVPMESSPFTTPAPPSRLYGFDDDDDVLLLLYIEPTKDPPRSRPAKSPLEWTAVIAEARWTIGNSYWPDSVFFGAVVSYYGKGEVGHAVALFPCENDDQRLSVCDSSTGKCHESVDEFIGSYKDATKNVVHRIVNYDMLLVFERKRTHKRDRGSVQFV